MEKVFVDTDIVLDLLGQREFFYKHAAELFSLADQRKISICLSSLSFANLHYILTRQLSAEQSRKKLSKLKTIVTILPVNEKVIELALSSDFIDFEDGIQYFTAIEQNMKIILTRNLKDYKTSQIPVLTAEQYIKISGIKP